jgi:hypothetical protein
VSERRDIRPDLEPGAPDELVSLAERLERERPVPAAAFRGELRWRLLFSADARTRPARLRLRLLIAGYAAAGSLLLLAGAASVAGAGPLGA